MLRGLQEAVEGVLPKTIKFRHHLHSMPELLYDVHKTASFVAEQLMELGYKVESGIGKTGIVAVLDTGKPGKTAALRGDMDALPIQEENDLPYASQESGKMHACGHDGHTVTLLAAAEVLSKLREQLTGKVKFIFQPAEEGGNGAQAMIDDGVLSDPDVDVIFGYHNWPKAPVGKILTKSGAILAGFSRFEISLKGKVGHVAMPEHAINPVIIASELIRELQAVPIGLPAEGPAPIINITYVSSGKPRTGMTDTGELMGYLYAAEPDNIETMKSRLTDITRNVLSRFKVADVEAQSEIKFVDVYHPTVNSLPETELVLSVAKELFGEMSVERLPQTIMASEDFSAYLTRIPGCFFFVGAGENSAALHTSKYDFNDTLLPNAIMMMCQATATYLAGGEKVSTDSEESQRTTLSRL